MMHRHFFTFPLMAISAYAAVAPEAIGGKVYRNSAVVPSLRQSWEDTIVFGADGRFIFLQRAPGGASVPAAPRKFFFQPRRRDGTYTYVRTGLATARIELTYDDATTERLDLTFTSATGGAADASNRFSFIDPAIGRAAAVINVSLRGRVAPGQPLIAGFVVPGTEEREVLVRAIGPGLAPSGGRTAWADPDFQLFKGTAPGSINEARQGARSVSVMSTSGVDAGVQKICALVDAFPLPAGSKDAADVVRLAPGPYTVICEPAAGDAGGEVLVEVYALS